MFNHPHRRGDKLFLAGCLLIAVGGCTLSDSDRDELEQMRASQNQMQLTMVAQTRQLDNLGQGMQQLQTQNDQQVQALLAQQKRNEQAQLKMAQKVCPPVEIPTCPELPDIGNKLIMGSRETFWVQVGSLSMDARIDTGATTSSIDAQNQEPFERDGKDWIRFTLTDPATGEEKQVETPVERFVLVKQASAEGRDRRAVVRLNVGIGNKLYNTEFSLNDRSQMDFPLLIGRTFLRDLAIVDVSRRYVMPPYKPTPAKATNNQNQ